MMWKPIAACVLALVAANAVCAAEPPATDAPARPKQASQSAPAMSKAAPATRGEAQPAVKTSSAAAAQPQTARRGQTDRLQLDTTVVTGNRELPKVLYIVPWKKADLGELPAQPFNTLLDEVLTPVDRDVFRREVTYYGVVSSGGNASPAAAASPNGTSLAPSRGDEK